MESPEWERDIQILKALEEKGITEYTVCILALHIGRTTPRDPQHIAGDMEGLEKSLSDWYSETGGEFEDD